MSQHLKHVQELCKHINPVKCRSQQTNNISHILTMTPYAILDSIRIRAKKSDDESHEATHEGCDIPDWFCRSGYYITDARREHRSFPSERSNRQATRWTIWKALPKQKQLDGNHRRFLFVFVCYFDLNCLYWNNPCTISFCLGVGETHIAPSMNLHQISSRVTVSSSRANSCVRLHFKAYNTLRTVNHFS